MAKQIQFNGYRVEANSFVLRDPSAQATVNNSLPVADPQAASSTAGRSTAVAGTRLQLLTVPLLVLGLGVLFWSRLQWIVHLSAADSLYSAWPLVPLVSLVIAYRKRHKIERYGGSAAGLVLVAIAVAAVILLDVTLVGLYFATPLLLILAISGVIVTAWGWRALRTLAFPVLFLLFMVPIQPSIRSRIDYPLQEMCARVTTAAARVVGIQIERAGATLLFQDPSLGVNVAPACNGLRSVLALILVAVLYLYLVRGSWYRKAAVLAVVIPLAYFANFLRLFGIVCFLEWGGQKLGGFEPIFDHVTGAILFTLAVLLLFVWARFLKCDQFQELG